MLYEGDGKEIMDIEDKLDLFIGEAFKKVIRAGKIKRKMICPPGLKAKDGRCVPMKAAEKKARKRAAIKRGRLFKTQKGKQIKAMKKRAKSMRKRAMGIPSLGAPSMEITSDKEKTF